MRPSAEQCADLVGQLTLLVMIGAAILCNLPDDPEEHPQYLSTASAKLWISGTPGDTVVWTVSPCAVGPDLERRREGWSMNKLGQMFKRLPAYEPGSAELINDPWGHVKNVAITNRSFS